MSGLDRERGQIAKARQSVMLKKCCLICVSFTSWEVSLRVIEAMWGVRGSIKVVAWWEVILHEARWEAAKVVRGRGLVERRRLLVGREGASEVWRPLHAERGLPLTPGGLVGLVVPWWLVVLATPVRWGFRLATPGPTVAGAAPVGVPLLVPHALVAVPRGAWWRGLSGVEGRLNNEMTYISAD